MELLILSAIALATVPAMLFQSASNSSVRWTFLGLFVATALGTLLAMPVMENGDAIFGETVLSKVHIVPIGIGYLLALNLLVIPFIYWIDKVHKNTNVKIKNTAEQTSRVPEAALHTLTAMGGAIGAFTCQQLFRHKRTKGSFQAIFFLTMITSFGIYYILWLALEPDMAKVDAWIDSIQLFDGIKLFNGG